MVRVAIFDYGAGNIFSLKNSFEKAGANVEVITNIDDFKNYSSLFSKNISIPRQIPKTGTVFSTTS